MSLVPTDPVQAEVLLHVCVRSCVRTLTLAHARAHTQTHTHTHTRARTHTHTQADAREEARLVTAARLIGLDDPCRLPRQACASGARTHTHTHTNTHRHDAVPDRASAAPLADVDL